jgi:hypothetical protein
VLVTAIVTLRTSVHAVMVAGFGFGIAGLELESSVLAETMFGVAVRTSPLGVHRVRLTHLRVGTGHYPPSMFGVTPEMMARDTILVIGAGASFGARSEDAHPPPMGSQLGRYLLYWYDANAPDEKDLARSAMMTWPLDFETPSRSIYRNHHHDPDVRPILVRAAERSATSDTGFEEVMDEILAEEHRETLDKVNLVLCFALMCGRACAFEPRPDLYDQLFSKLQGRLRGIITPNYDLLVEEALSRAGLTYRYRAYTDPGSDGVASVVLDKFHGSANFILPPGNHAAATVEAAWLGSNPIALIPQARIFSYTHGFGVHVTPGDRRKNAIAELKNGGRSHPVLVTYGPGKDATHGREFLNQIRNECAAELRSDPPGRVIGIGISPPRGRGDDDAWESLCKQLAGLNCVKEYWSGKESERESMRALGFEPHEGYFRQLLASL